LLQCRVECWTHSGTARVLVACCLLRVVCCALSVACCMSSVAMLHVVCRMLSVACCPLHVVCCMPSVACCPLHVAPCVLSVACVRGGPPRARRLRRERSRQSRWCCRAFAPVEPTGKAQRSTLRCAALRARPSRLHCRPNRLQLTAACGCVGHRGVRSA
jgi:hypothetical protein